MIKNSAFFIKKNVALLLYNEFYGKEKRTAIKY
jgi:hypothetical protein